MEAAAAVESQPESVDESRAATSDEDVRGEPATPELSPEDAAEEEMMASAAASRAKFLEIEKAAAKPTWNGQDEVRKMKFGNRLAQFESGRANSSSDGRRAQQDCGAAGCSTPNHGRNQEDVAGRP